MRPPFAAVETNPGIKWSLLAGLALGTLVVGVRLTKLNQVLKTEGPPAPQGIVSYELAGSETRANAILAAWTAIPGAIVKARQSLVLDFLFLGLYSTSLAYLCYLVGAMFKPATGWSTAGLWLMYGQWLAAGLDAVENMALLAMLNRRQAKTPLPQLALLAAASKFLLIILGIGYILLGFVRSRAHRA